MANPVINSVVVTPDPVPVDQPADILVSASDADNASVTGSITVTDSQGNEATGPFAFNIFDTLTYAVIVSQGTVTQDAGNPALWHWSP